VQQKQFGNEQMMGQGIPVHGRHGSQQRDICNGAGQKKGKKTVGSNAAGHDLFLSGNGLCFGICFITDLKINALFSSTGFKFCHICRFLLFFKRKNAISMQPNPTHEI
jgi:hypothetical protein